MKDKLREIPPVAIVMDHPLIAREIPGIPRHILTREVRRHLSRLRDAIMGGADPGSREQMAEQAVTSALESALGHIRGSLVPVINCTGVMLHTNLGRAVLPSAVFEGIRRAGEGYSNLEFDLESGQRGSRHVHLAGILQELTGAEDALMVNNNAGAVLLVADTFARGREVVVSRGEIIEIGGSFRLHEVLKKGGAILREVGCTNRTHPNDYIDAINENTAFLLKSHTSNYTVKGFHTQVPGGDMARIALDAGVLSVEDLGSGLLVDLSCYGLHGEYTVADVVRSGIDIITFSGDKLLGGPQGGIILGSRENIRRLAKNPLTRALRPGKLAISAMEATLNLYRYRDTLEESIPFLGMLAQTPGRIEERARSLADGVRRETTAGVFEIIDGFSRTGGGAFPDADIPTRLLSIDIPGTGAQEIYLGLSHGPVPVICRILDNRVVLDMRTVLPRQEDALTEAVIKIIRGKG